MHVYFRFLGEMRRVGSNFAGMALRKHAEKKPLIQSMNRRCKEHLEQDRKLQGNAQRKRFPVSIKSQKVICQYYTKLCGIFRQSWTPSDLV